MDIGAALKAIQAERGVRNVDLQRALNVKAPEVSRWRAMKDARVSHVKMLADFFGVSIDEFLTYQ